MPRKKPIVLLIVIGLAAATFASLLWFNRWVCDPQAGPPCGPGAAKQG